MTSFFPFKTNYLKKTFYGSFKDSLDENNNKKLYIKITYIDEFIVDLLLRLNLLVPITGVPKCSGFVKGN